MAVNQSDQISTDPASFNSSDSTKQNCQKTITVMKLHVNSFSNSTINGSSLSNESQNENTSILISGSCTTNPEDQNSNNLNSINVKLYDGNNISKGEILQQLSTNALPPYTPGSPPRFIKQDIKSFDINCCTDCGDTFALKSSLNFHLERRSVLIKFPCETCKVLRIFYNRCNLLSHIRSHTDQNEKSDIGKAIITVLPRVFMDGIQNEFVNTLDDELNTMDDNETVPPSEMLECSLQELDESIIPIQENEVVKDVKIIKVKCLDCNEEFESAYDRKEHLTNGDKIPVPMSQCDKCGLVCPSKCSLKAHQRIHLQISPYVCPECGESPDPHWNNFLDHVNYQCFHNTRSVGYKCPVCKRVSPTNASLLKHMELHTEKYAKCSECPRAYNSTQAFKAHNNIYHDGVSVQYTMIFKCSLCDIVFVSNDQMLNHRSTHLKEQVCEYVFNCMQCGKPLESKALLQDHVRTHHPKTYKQTIRAIVSNKPTKQTILTYRGNVECLLCNSIFYSQQGYSVHVSRAHININQKCYYCAKLIPNRKEMIKHGKLHLQDKTDVCLLCNNKKFNDAQELDSHLDNHIKKLKFCSFCPVCDRLFPTSPDALNHLREEHFLPMKHEVTSLKSGNTFIKPVPNTVCHFCRDSFVSVVELQVHLKNEHNIDGQNSGRSDDSQSNAPPFKKQRTIGNTCAKCQFQSAVREDFKKHILSHKSNRATFQCQECGLCFIVEPSLGKHLRIVHKISDTVKYIKEEGTNYVPEADNSTDTSKRSGLECSVCFTSFPNEPTLNKHMRSHGMAFIQANKSGLL